MELKPSKLKWFAVFLTGALFAATGVWMVRDGDAMGWLAGGFFGLVALVALPMLLGVGSYLKLGPEGFEQSLMGRKLFCRWDEVSEIGDWKMKQGLFSVHSGVTFDRASDKDTALIAFNRSVSGGSTGLGDTFGMKAADLAALMNAFRNRALDPVAVRLNRTAGPTY